MEESDAPLRGFYNMADLNLAKLLPATFLNDNSHLQNLGEELSLCDSGNVVFHWADFNETCESIRSQLNENAQLSIDFNHKHDSLEKLKLIPVWINSASNVYQTTMYDLYQGYIFNQIKGSMGVDPFGPIEISFISSTGPFKSMAIAECFNRSTYKDFILVNLLRGKLPKREFRIRLKSKILMEYGEDFQQAILINLEQVTTQGMLLSIDSQVYSKSVSKSQKIRLLLDTSGLVATTEMKIPQMKSHLSQYAFNLMYSSKKEDAVFCSVSDFKVASSFEFLKNNRIHLFVPYQKFESTKTETLSNLQAFVNHSKELVREYFQLIKERKIA